MATAFPELSELDKVLNKLGEDFLSCAICLELFKKPKVLPCNHSFCEPCLTTLVKKAGKLNCPTCGMPCQLPDGGVSELKANFFINSLADLYLNQSPKTDDTQPSVCHGCEERKAKHWCIDCSMKLCASCTKSHKKFMRGHKVMTLDEYKEANSSSLLLQQNVYCSVHPDNVVKFYCEKCEVTVCSDCAIIKHRSAEHVLRDLQEAAGGSQWQEDRR